MTQMELFAGIGGFGLAGEWAGIESVVQVEWNDYCQKVLQKNFPNALRFGDITKFDGTPFRGAVDIVSGGFPCQPYSTAGKRLGKEDERHLWPEMLRIIREVAPRWVVGENVRGLVSWNGGLVFDEVQSDLEAAGYEVVPFLLPACGVNAPHRRDRIWFVAHAEKADDCRTSSQISSKNGGQKRNDFSEFSNTGFVSSNAEHVRLEVWNEQQGWRETQPIPKRRCGFHGWRNFPSQSPVCGRNDGISNRVDRIDALGNAIVPEVAFQIFKAIVEYEKQWEHSQA